MSKAQTFVEHISYAALNGDDKSKLSVMCDDRHVFRANTSKIDPKSF